MPCCPMDDNYPCMVEISEGGIDYTNPDALVEKYDGEFETFNTATEAVNKGLEILKQWKKDCPDKRIGIGIGYTGGNTMPFEPCNEKKILKLAKQIDKEEQMLVFQ